MIEARPCRRSATVFVKLALAFPELDRARGLVTKARLSTQRARLIIIGTLLSAPCTAEWTNFIAHPQEDSHARHREEAVWDAGAYWRARR
jgi:uncharacterized membrane protein YidH (DUF202 family)